MSELEKAKKELEAVEMSIGIAERQLIVLQKKLATLIDQRRTNEKDKLSGENAIVESLKELKKL